MNNRKNKIIVMIISLVIALAISEVDSSYFQSDSSGPVFKGSYLSTAHVPSNQPVYISITSKVYVYDSDRVDTVIACYKISSTTSWQNTTMNWVQHMDNDSYAGFDYYSANLANFTMIFNTEPTQYYIDIKYYANDTLDNWNESEIFNYAVAYSSDGNPLDYGFDFASLIVPFDIMLPLVLIVSCIIVSVILVRKHQKQL
jgi:hypothetical protein